MGFGRMRNAAYRITRRAPGNTIVGKTESSGRNVYVTSNGTYKTANGTPVTMRNGKYTTTRRVNRNKAIINARQRKTNNYMSGINQNNLGRQLANANAEYKRMLNEKKRLRR